MRSRIHSVRAETTAPVQYHRVDHDPASQVRHPAHLAGANLATQRDGIPTGMKRTTPARLRCCRVPLSFGHGRRPCRDFTAAPPHYLSGNDRGKTKCVRAGFVRWPDKSKGTLAPALLNSQHASTLDGEL